MMLSLNPCFSGTYFLRGKPKITQQANKCLNPCFSGTYFLRYALELCQMTFIRRREPRVAKGLNPCFSGTYFLSLLLQILKKLKKQVLILVLVELTF